jgi:cyclopropane fatty-acyl-phospholipid synthase-like methyltransferase
MDNDITRWETGEGVALMRNLGVRAGHTVLDFGCRAGHYAIAASHAAGPEGSVIAVDKDGEALASLTTRLAELKLSNIHVVHTDGGVRFPAERHAVDLLVVFDVIQFFLPQERVALYADARRVLKPSGALAMHAKHFGDDFRARFLKDSSEAEIIAEVVAAGFRVAHEYLGPLCHGDGIEQGHAVVFVASGKA